MNRDPRFVVIGAGVGGLFAAIALRRAGFDVDVYERAPAIEPVGFGLCMWPNGAKALHAIGVGTELEPVSPVLHSVDLRTEDGELLSSIAMDDLAQRTRQRPYPLARVDLLDVLLDAAGREHVHLGAECASVEPTAAGARAIFTDGREAVGDLVIGADGLRSTVRRHVVGHDGQLNYISSAWESLIDARPYPAPPGAFTFWIGASRRAAVMPVSGNRLYCFFDLPASPDHGVDVIDPRIHLRHAFAGWCEPVQMVIERLDPHTTLPVRYCDLDPLDTYARGRVVLLGDAAHATTPTLGQGAAQAAEDAIVLVRLLKAWGGELEPALRAYDAERRRRTQEVVLAARAQTRRIVGVDPADTARWYESLRAGSRDFVEKVEALTLSGPLETHTAWA